MSNKKTIEWIFESLWADYIALNPSALKIHKMIAAKESVIINDHVAFRTYGIEGMRIEDLAKHFISLGYTEGGSYYFEAKRLNAKHFDPPEKNQPKVFISELILEKCSKRLLDTIASITASLGPDFCDSPEFLWAGRPWGAISHATYKALQSESEYAAWLYVFGFRANHFTIDVNALTSVQSLEQLNLFLKQNDVQLNSSGGEIKGGPSVFLSQSATLADKIQVEFEEGVYAIPSCFYEFALRHHLPDGTLFGGFVEGNANTIFESTNAS